MSPSAKDVTIDSEFIKCLVIGDYGTGKSVFATSFPTPAFVFDFDKGIQTYRGKDFDYEQFDATAQGWVKFEKDLKELIPKVNEGKYKSVIVDSTTLMAAVAMERALALDPKRSVTQGPLWNVHYGIVKNLVEGKLRQILQLKCNIAILAHIRIDRDEESGAVLGTSPLLPGDMKNTFPGYFDEVYFAFSKTVQNMPKFYLQTLPKGYYKARSRISGKEQLLPMEIPNDFEELMKLIKEAAGKKGAVK